ncbi:Uncharacterized protein TPAR_08840 [Tolypocladium paradoxum]|uniref:Uncharacterized protein n=1 Tax=Tolypocladium paradoxum TaxID=94208 RepID=A0A2S4KLG4_9HYPO|nr:Uncharacterized protein TPAR_08840 [Tolypocladium paradoxum]
MATSETRSVWSDATSATSSHESTSARLVSEEDDPLIPTASDVCRTFHDGKATWEAFLSNAVTMPQGLWPAGTLDPYLTLSDVPGLPAELPRGNILHGRQRWHMRQCTRDTETARTDNQDDEWDPTIVYGRRVLFSLGNDGPIYCDIVPEAASCFLGNNSTTTHSLAVLTMCWSYILSVRFLEMQGREVRYSTHRLWPWPGEDPRRHMIYLDGASPALVRWLCAILCSYHGWGVRDKGLLPPWAASLTTDVRFSIAAPAPAPTTNALSAPSSFEATGLLLELCQLFGLGSGMDQNEEWELLPPYKAAFFAALMLPFYKSMDLRPQFPCPHLARTEGSNRFSSIDEKSLRQYVDDLRYFMTLSMHAPSLGSILWSVFWQPDVECNLVSPWFASALDTLEPIINERRLETLVKVFVSRRPRVAFWWLALFLLGDLSVVDWIRQHAETQTEKYGFGTLSPPDPMVSAWTGSKQSFLDYERTTCYPAISDLVSRADLLRCRFDFRLQDWTCTSLSWRPFGHLRKQDIEPDLWPWLETEYSRQYHSFIWHSKTRPNTTGFGFRRDTGRDIKQVPDDLERRLGDKCQGECQHDMKRAPSKKSTLTMISLLVTDFAGSRHWANAAMPFDFKQHPWLHDWEGLAIMEVRCKPDADIADKRPSWFLDEWMKGKHEGGDMDRHE